MFNINKEVQRLQQLQHDKIHGLPYKPRQGNPKVQHVDHRHDRPGLDMPFDIKAEQENTYIVRRFRNKSADFGRRLSKRKGQYHRPGGGFAGCNIRLC